MMDKDCIPYNINEAIKQKLIDASELRHKFHLVDDLKINQLHTLDGGYDVTYSYRVTSKMDSKWYLYHSSRCTISHKDLKDYIRDASIDIITNKKPT